MAVNPKSITTSGIRVKRVLHDDGAGGFSVARIAMPNGTTCLGIRWNGEGGYEEDGDARGSQGYPTSRGKPVFFTIPDELEDVIAAHYGERIRK